LRLDDEAIVVLLGELSRSADDLVDEFRQIHRLGIEFELAGFDLREVEYLVDEAEEVGRGNGPPAVPSASSSWLVTTPMLKQSV
jgi:hypothetical protein